MLFPKRVLILTILLFFMSLTFSAASAGEELSFTTDRPRVEVGVDFNGAAVKFAGRAPEGSQVYVKATGPVRPVNLSKQGKKNFLWLTVESVGVEGMPAFFKVLSSNGFNHLPPDVREATGITGTYDLLMKNARVAVRNEEVKQELVGRDASAYLNALISVNEREGLYGYVEKGIKVHNGEFAGTLYLPANVPYGCINLKVYAVKDGVIVARDSGRIDIGPVGLIRLADQAAEKYSPLYGAASIGVALAAGFAVAQLFKKLNGLLGRQDSFTAGH
ncbi:MAG: TIGR02186 family protein [Bacillota bacterium]|uniref:TIGR02186 family protein n=1 Tax=Desulforudis sp. DRI-14 TaxID=3459793 RepID=UPI003473E40C